MVLNEYANRGSLSLKKYDNPVPSLFYKQEGQTTIM